MNLPQAANNNRSNPVKSNPFNPRNPMKKTVDGVYVIPITPAGKYKRRKRRNQLSFTV